MNDLRYFQFLAGERKGEVVLFDKIEQEDGINFISFKDGSRCNEEFILPLNASDWEGKLMAEVSDHNNIWRITEEWVGRTEEKWETNKDGENVCVQPFVPGRKKIVAIPPRKTQSKFGLVTQVETHKQNNLIQDQNINTNDPVWIMLDKAKKFAINVPMELLISLPSKSLYNVAKESFENGSTKVIDYIISNLDNSKLKDSLKVALLSAYEDNDEEIADTKKPLINNTEASLYEPEVLDEPIIGEAKLDKK